MKRLSFAAAVAVAMLFAISATAAVTVSSKIDTEANLLGNMIKVVLEEAGIEVNDRIGLGGTPIVRQAIIGGEIDIYNEYTGNAAFFYNRADETLWNDHGKGYAEAKKLDYDEHRIVWLTPAPANNTWAIAVRRDLAEPNGLKTMSDFGQFVESGGDLKLACSAEFVHSPAALPAFQEAYGFELPTEQLLVFAGGDTAATSKAAADGTDGTNAAMVYGTDGAIAELGLVVMEDDRGVQPVYAPTAIIREDALARHPEIETLLKPVYESLDLETLQMLNARIQLGGENAGAVARDYLAQNGFID